MLLADLMNRNLGFASYVRRWEQEVVKRDMIPLLSYLILPVQRIPRYNMLLRDLVKQTEESHPDYENLSKVFRFFFVENQNGTFYSFFLPCFFFLILSSLHRRSKKWNN